MPCASATRRASAAGSWPGSSPSGRLLMIVRMPAAASASMSARSSRPAALNPGANGKSWGAMPVLHDLYAADSQPRPLASLKNRGKKASSGELRRPVDQIPGAQPKPFQATQRRRGGLQILDTQRRLRQHVDVTLVHRGEPVAQSYALFRQAHTDRPPVVQGTLLRQIAVFDHLFDVVRDIRAEIAAPQCKLADRHFRFADVEQHHSLDIVDVVDAEPLEFELYDFQEMTMQSLDQRNHLEISSVHPSLGFRQ